MNISFRNVINIQITLYVTESVTHRMSIQSINNSGFSKLLSIIITMLLYTKKSLYFLQTIKQNPLNLKIRLV